MDSRQGDHRETPEIKVKSKVGIPVFSFVLSGLCGFSLEFYVNP
jgi:hypothetical protein